MHCFGCVTICVCTACEEGYEPYTLESPEISPSAVPGENSVVVNLPDVNGVSPPDYQIMEVIVENTGSIFPITVLIYDESGHEIYSVSVVIRPEKRAIFYRQCHGQHVHLNSCLVVKLFVSMKMA